MGPIANMHRHAAAAPSRAPSRTAAAAAAYLCFGLLSFGAGHAQEPPETPPRRSEVAPERYRQQPSPERARDLLRQEEVLPSPEERREELRTLNQIYRELMPESRGTVPATGLAPEPEPGSQR